jgi:hypothetical protein
MVRGTAALAYSYFLHWLKKEDLYSQQSPFVFTCYQELIKQLAFAIPLVEDPNNLASTSFCRPSIRGEQPSIQMPDGQNNPYWKPTQKGITLISYFCGQTPAQQVLEIGTGNGVLTRKLEQVTMGTLHSLEEDQGLWEKAQSKGIPSTNYLLGTVQERLPAILQGLNQLDFLLVNSLFSKEVFQEIFEHCKPKIHSESILALAHIHRSKDMEKTWAAIQADPSVQLTIDFFDYGLVWFAYPGPKTHLILSI